MSTKRRWNSLALKCFTYFSFSCCQLSCRGCCLQLENTARQKLSFALQEKSHMHCCLTCQAFSTKKKFLRKPGILKPTNHPNNNGLSHCNTNLFLNSKFSALGQLQGLCQRPSLWWLWHSCSCTWLIACACFVCDKCCCCSGYLHVGSGQFLSFLFYCLQSNKVRSCLCSDMVSEAKSSYFDQG